MRRFVVRAGEAVKTVARQRSLAKSHAMEFAIATHWGSGLIHYHLEEYALRVHSEASGRDEIVPFERIRRIHLRQDMPGVFSADVRVEGGPLLRLTSRHFLGVGRFEDRSAAYVAFVRALIAATARAHPTVELLAGSSLLFGLGWVLIVAACLLAALSLAALASGVGGGRLPPLRGLVALPIAFVVGLGFVRQGRGKTFTADAPPATFFPA